MSADKATVRNLNPAVKVSARKFNPSYPQSAVVCNEIHTMADRNMVAYGN